ncbi:tRNA pseudouridine synthase a, putative [Ichthyophthirius multifiliis]|uniref:tRNA pseudouridine synthase n=1 Tax=Ichthyophthirius multifiliis TaxID=5932 RepID=G0QRQ9_ICHMU|nr:tRNA pseudouridine synthase a, putative [Ichthyophthirius multifiliis]EGR32098.1 tRNA pseudouridine synthase a, putative [Ichthyophthirius multifiliis]|eukprot:XP_004035584.1 tRNA pseudouridine synthase a, putative [Ichthyophthirius multifiliis]
MNDLKKAGWSRGARTDKGVHALINGINVKLAVTKEFLRDPDIEKEHVLENAINTKQQQKNAIERKNQINYDKIIQTLNSNLPQDIRIISLKQVTKKFDIRTACSHRIYEYILPLFMLQKFEDIKENKKVFLQIEQQIQEKINQILKKFIGTKSYHNYTKQLKAGDSKCKRYIINMKGQIFEKNQEKFVRFTFFGQSFIYHQIRKMIGMICMVFQKQLELDFIDKSFEKEFTKVWLAPAHGLFLNQMVFDQYNKRQEIPELIVWDENEIKRIEEMRNIIEYVVMNVNIVQNLYFQWAKNVNEGIEIQEIDEGLSNDGGD